MVRSSWVGRGGGGELGAGLGGGGGKEAGLADVSRRWSTESRCVVANFYRRHEISVASREKNKR